MSLWTVLKRGQQTIAYFSAAISWFGDGLTAVSIVYFLTAVGRAVNCKKMSEKAPSYNAFSDNSNSPCELPVVNDRTLQMLQQLLTFAKCSKNIVSKAC